MPLIGFTLDCAVGRPVQNWKMGEEVHFAFATVWGGGYGCLFAALGGPSHCRATGAWAPSSDGLGAGWARRHPHQSCLGVTFPGRAPLALHFPLRADRDKQDTLAWMPHSWGCSQPQKNDDSRLWASVSFSKMLQTRAKRSLTQPRLGAGRGVGLR